MCPLHYSHYLASRMNSSGNRALGPAVDVTGDRSKVQCCKEQYCIGTWNVTSMNQSKLDEVKHAGDSFTVEPLGKP